MAQLVCALSVGISLSAHAATVSAHFLGRNANTTLQPNEVAGLDQQPFWANIDQEAPLNRTGTSDPLLDNSGNFTSVTFSFSGNDSWNSNGPDVTPDERAMLGLLKQSGAGSTAKFSLNNLGAGPYDVIVYLGMDADGVTAEISANGTVKPVTETHQFGDAYLEATPDIAGNYVRFNGVAPTNGVIGIGMKYIAGGNGAGMAGVQVLGASFPTNTTAAGIKVQPKSISAATGSRSGFAVQATSSNVKYQWFKNGSAISGATSASYSTDVLTLADSGSKYKVTLSNNVNSVTSDEVTLTVLNPVLAKGFLTEEYFLNIGGTAVVNLTDSAKYKADAPDVTVLIAGFSSAVNYADNYGAKVSGFIIPTDTGDYDFFIGSDDNSALFLSTDANPPDLTGTPIAFESGCCNPFMEPGANQTTQTPIHLVAGQQYAVVALHKEGGGGDYVKVAMRNVLDTTAAASLQPIAGNLIGTLVLPDAVITPTVLPASVTVSELTGNKFTAAATAATPRGSVPVRYQWRKNGSDIPNATSPTYTVLSAPLASSGDKYSVLIGAPGAPDFISPDAILTVVADHTPPVIVSAGALNKVNPDQSAAGIEVDLVMDEPLDVATLVPGNFTLSAGSITSVRYSTNVSGFASRQRGIVLATTGLAAGGSYTVTVQNVADIFGNKITSASAPFTVSKLSWIILGNENANHPSDAVEVGTNGFNLTSGGNGYWNNQDDATFVYEPVTGDFDKVARVEYQDPSSQWGRAGLAVRESLDSSGTVASRYQQVHANPAIRADGGASNNSFETNRRLATGGATSSNNGGGTPAYPNAWIRLRRAGDKVSMYHSDDAVTWTQLGTTDFNPADGSGSALPATMFVGFAYGPESGNNGLVTAGLDASWTVRFRDYADFTPNKAVGKQTYALGVNFTDVDNGTRDYGLGPKEIAGVDAVAQANWNNALGKDSVIAGAAPQALVADKAGVAAASTATVEWSGAPNTWASTGRGEENNLLVGSDHSLMTGFLDTSNDSTTQVTVHNIPSDLTSGKYDVVVYDLGGVASGRGGAYRVTDISGNTLADYVYAEAPTNPTNFVQVPTDPKPTPGDGTTYGVGNYIVFTGLTAKEIIIEGTTQVVTLSDGTMVDVGVGGTQRAPINAVQLVSPSGLLTPVKPTISISGKTITFTGKLLSSDELNGPYTEVVGATSPRTVDTTAAAKKFYRAGN